MSPARALPALALTILVVGAGLLGMPALGQEPSQPQEKKVPQVPASLPAGVAVEDERLYRDVKYWQTALKADPENVTVRLALGNAYALNNRQRDAIREFRKVLRDYPDYKIGWNNLGSSYRALRRHGQALRAFRKALDLDPHYGLVHYNLGVIYDAEGHFDEAIEEYGLAFKYEPDLVDIKKNPQVVTNRHLYAALLRNYIDSEGGIVLPLEMAFPKQPRE